MLLVMFVIFVVLAIAGFAFLSSVNLRGERARLLRERLAAVEHAAERRPSEELALLRDELISEIPALNRLLGKSRKIARLQQLLSQAALTMRAGKFLLVSVFVAACCAILTMLLLDSGRAALAAFVFSGLIPAGYVSVRRKRRFAAFEALFPEAIDLFGRAVRAGHSFDTALELIANELAEPVAGEFRKLYEEQKFGLPTRDAMLNLADRIPVFDVKFFVTAVLLQRETGGNLAEILDKLSYLIRERFKIRRQVRVYTAQGRLTMAILLALPPGLAVIMQFIAPALMQRLYTDPIGHALIATGLVMETIGFLLINKIVHIRV